MMHYDWADDARKSYALAIQTLREQLLRQRGDAQMKQDVDQDAIAIGTLYRKHCSSGIESARCGISCGFRLLAKKPGLGHGKWLPWLEVNGSVLGFDDDSTAQRLMRAARSWCAEYGNNLEEAKTALTRDLLTVDCAVKILREIWGNDNHRALGTGENEWFTPLEWIERARTILGTINLDPASCPKAQSIVKAEHFFTKAQNGLKLKWHGNVWLNPPYTQPDIEQFALKAVAEYRNRNIDAALILTHNYTDTAWFHVLASSAAHIAFTSGRIRFVDAAGEQCSPTQGQALFCLGGDDALHDRFLQELDDVAFITTGGIHANTQRVEPA